MLKALIAVSLTVFECKQSRRAAIEVLHNATEEGSQPSDDHYVRFLLGFQAYFTQGSSFDTGVSG
jgi:hypothetical protein